MKRLQYLSCSRRFSRPRAAGHLKAYQHQALMYTSMIMRLLQALGCWISLSATEERIFILSYTEEVGDTSHVRLDRLDAARSASDMLSTSLLFISLLLTWFKISSCNLVCWISKVSSDSEPPTFSLLFMILSEVSRSVSCLRPSWPLRSISAEWID